jgi:Fe-S cluster assembly ATP-binding protein
MSLNILHLSVRIAQKQILEDVSMTVKDGEMHVLMGPNGSGKSTLAHAVMGNTVFEIRNQFSEISLNGKKIQNMKTDERAKKGLFLAFQNPVSIPGVSVANLLKIAYQGIGNQNTKVNNLPSHNPALSVFAFHEMLVKKAKILGIPQELLRKSLNEDFSGGEKKKLEILQALILSPKYAIFDEVDAGLDVDALKIVAQALKELQKQGSGILLITHSQRILQYLEVDKVTVMVNGKIKETGDKKLVEYIEKNGYKKWTINK